MKHIIYIICTAFLCSVLFVSCASRKVYKEHKDIQAAAVSGSSMIANTIQIDSVLKNFKLSADSIVIVSEPYLIPYTDSIYTRTTINIRSPTIRNITEKTSTISTSIIQNDSIISKSIETSDIYSDAQLSQDSGATSIILLILIGIVAIIMVALVVLVRRFIQ